MKNQDVIFLIESQVLKQSTRLSIERLTQKKVFHFFSIEEASLYLKLKPSTVIYSSDNDQHEARRKFPCNINFIDISEKINQEGKGILLKHASITEKLLSLLKMSLN